MAKLRTYRSPRHNLPLGNEDKLARDLLGALTKDSNTSTLFPAVFWTQTPILAPPPVLPPAPAQVLPKSYVSSF